MDRVVFCRLRVVEQLRKGKKTLENKNRPHVLIGRKEKSSDKKGDPSLKVGMTATIAEQCPKSGFDSEIFVKKRSNQFMKRCKNSKQDGDDRAVGPGVGIQRARCKTL